MPSSDVDDNLNTIMLPLLTEMSEQPDISHTTTYFETKRKLKAWSDRRTAAVLEAVRKEVFGNIKSRSVMQNCEINGDWLLEILDAELAALSPKPKQPAPAAPERGGTGNHV